MSASWQTFEKTNDQVATAAGMGSVVTCDGLSIHLMSSFEEARPGSIDALGFTWQTQVIWSGIRSLTSSRAARAVSNPFRGREGFPTSSTWPQAHLVIPTGKGWQSGYFRVWRYRRHGRGGGGGGGC